MAETAKLWRICLLRHSIALLLKPRKSKLFRSSLQRIPKAWTGVGMEDLFFSTLPQCRVFPWSLFMVLFGVFIYFILFNSSLSQTPSFIFFSVLFGSLHHWKYMHMVEHTHARTYIHMHTCAHTCLNECTQTSVFGKIHMWTNHAHAHAQPEIKHYV